MEGGEKLNKLTKILTVTLIAALAFTIGYAVNPIAVHQNPSVSYNVQVFKDGIQISEAGNVITDIGEDWIADWIGLAGADNTTARSAAQWISLSNDASPDASWTKLTNEVAANGFTRALGDVAAWTNSGDSAFNVTKTFTATGTQQLQCAGLNWAETAESDNNLFACAAFTQTTFNSGDTLTITWSITINAN